MSDLLNGLDRDQLMKGLPATLARHFATLDSTATDWNAVGVMLAAGPATSVALKGPGNWSNALWDGAKSEFRKFLCSESAEYADLRAEWAGLKQKGGGIAVGALSGAIGAKLGVAAGVLAPMTIWLLMVAMRMGKGALCAALSAPPQAPPPAS